MARAKARRWLGLGAGLLLGLAPQQMTPAQEVEKGKIIRVAQPGNDASRSGGTPSRPSGQPRAALSQAIEEQERGAYEAAAPLIQTAIAGQRSLSAKEQALLAKLAGDNRTALAARRDAMQDLRKADDLLKKGSLKEAQEHIRRAAAKQQYLQPKYRDHLSYMWRYATGGKAVPRPATSTSAKPEARPAEAEGGNPMVEAFKKVQLARAELARYNFDVAEQLAREAQEMKVRFVRPEDSPQRILEEISQARKDPKVLLAASRAALAGKEFDRAEKLARQAEQMGSWTFTVFGDKPSRVLEDIAEARARGTDPRPVQSADGGTKPPETDRSKTQALQLVRQGRAALQKGDVAAARDYAEQARKLQARFTWWDDTPEKLLADVAKKGSAPQKEVVEDTPPEGGEIQQVEHREVKPVENKPRANKDEARDMLDQGRALMEQGKFEEATEMAMKVKRMSWISWGIFDRNTPDRLLLDIRQGRAEHSKEESVKVLAQGRDLLTRGDLEGATRAAYQAQTLHGPYSIWDFGDRPEKLLSDIEVAKREQRAAATANPEKVKEQPDQLTQREPERRPAPPPVPTPTPTAENPPRPTPEDRQTPEKVAYEKLEQARVAIRRGDIEIARKLADDVKRMNVKLDPQIGSPEQIHEELNRIESFNQAITKVEQKEQDARKLLAEARRLQKENKLVDAHKKALEANQLGAKFGLDEDSPTLAVQQLEGLARKHIEVYTKRADEFARYGTDAPEVRFEKARKCLVYSQYLARAFRQDEQEIHARLEWLERTRTGNSAVVQSPTIMELGGASSKLPGPGADIQKVAHLPDPTPSPTTPNQGSEYLEKARLELRAGELANARRLAEEAFNGPYQVREEALAVLRTIDTEEFNQRCLEACRTFDSAMQAYRRREYNFARNIVKEVDVRLLDPDRQGRLREVLMTPEMHQPAPSELVQTGHAGDPQPGHSQATDSVKEQTPSEGKQELTLLETTRAKREVFFQAMEQKGRDVRRQALEKFRTGQAEEAVKLLEEHLHKLATADMEPGQMALLKKPIDQRLSQFKLLAEQQKWLAESTQTHEQKTASRAGRFLAEENKNKKIAELMKEFNNFYRDAQYKEAYLAANKAKEIDPDNAHVTAAAIMAQRKLRLDEWKDIKGNNERFTYEVMKDTGRMPDADTIESGITYDKDRWDDVRKRPLDGTTILGHQSAAEREIERRLDTNVTLTFQNTPLYRVIEELRAMHGLNIDFDTAALDREGIDVNRPVSVHLDQIKLKSALNVLLRKVHLTWIIRDDILQITTPSGAKGKQRLATYQVADLVIPVQDFGTINTDQVNPQFGKPLTPPRPGSNGGVSPQFSPNSLSTGTPVGSPGGSNYSPFGGSDPTSGSTNGVTVSTSKTREDMLIKLIISTIKPETWRDMGGPGTIEFFPLTMSLVINQDPQIQEEIQELLAALRRLQDQEVSVEIRFITVREAFYERMGVNFNMNIRNEHNTERFEPLLTSGVLRPGGFINKFIPNDFLTGLTPAGTFTPDLNIPINNTTFFSAIPPFGGYQAGVGGITMGLAFLSDIQVFMFLEAVQADQRSNVMLAPRMTLFNGQTAVLNVSTSQNMVVGGAVDETVPGTGRFVFIPLISPQPVQANVVQIQAVITGDRRFVRLSLAPQFFSTDSAGPIDVFPISFPIFPTLTPGLDGNPVVFNQFIQQPIVNTISIGTTVLVPDGGTVLLGGLKFLNEGRNELGPPILSKIPYVNRLFKNVGYGRESASLMLMVTPRIIIQEEEEFRQTGYSAQLPPVGP